MKIQEITITDVKAVESLTLRPGALTVISGENGRGKSSVLDAISVCFEGGHDPGLIRKGAKRAQVSMLLDTGVTVEATITPKGTKLDITSPDGTAVRAPREYMEKLAAGFSYNPTALIDCPAKQRAQFLLEAMPIVFETDEVACTLEPVLGGVDVAKFIQWQPAALDLDGLAKLRQRIYELRTVENRTGKDAQGTIHELKRSLPEDAGIDWNAALADAEKALVTANQILLQETTSIVEQASRTIAELKKEAQAKIDAINAQLTVDCEAVRRQESADKEALNEDAREQTRPYVEAKAEALRNIEDQGRAKAAREMLEAAQQKYNRSKGIEEALSFSLESLDNLRLKKLQSLPIQGVEVRDGELFVDGVAWKHVNTARQYAVCFELASLKMGELGVMVCDKAEAMSDATFAEFTEAAAGAGLQIITARVSEGPLKVEVAA